MHITYACPRCGNTDRHHGVEKIAELVCQSCGESLPIPDDALGSTNPDETSALRLRRCVVCPSTELFRRKDFPQRLGVAIVLVGLFASCIAWGMRELVLTFAILFSTALLDVILYFVMPECLTCYRCGARYTGNGVVDSFGGFDLETHEKHRQLVARTRSLSSGRTSAPPSS